VAGEPGTVLSLSGVRYGFRSRPDFLGPIDLELRPGDFWALVGPNGSGKTTLLRLIAGLLRPAAGEIRLGGRRLAAIPARERARRLAYMPQTTTGDLDFTAGQVVLLGRYPHRGWGMFESPHDEGVARQAMELTGTLSFAERRLMTLSGGEAQRVHLAAAFAQEPEILLLDEPTASLDLAHQVAIFRLLRERAQGPRLAVIVATHDLNLAARYSSHMLVMQEGKRVAAGPPTDVLCSDVLEEAFGVALVRLRDQEGHTLVIPVECDRGGVA